MYAVKDDRVVARNEIPPPVTGAPDPRLVVGERFCALTYITDSVLTMPKKFARNKTQYEVTLLFENVTSLMFGYPNDEALGGHPLYDKGLRHYRVYEVQNSSWITLIKQTNEKSFPGKSQIFDGDRHIIITFQDSTFECLFGGKIRLRNSMDEESETKLSFV